MKFFTSDQHFNHINVLKYCNRPFKDSQEMDEILIYNWNTIITPNDSTYIVGDFSFHKDTQISRLAALKPLIFR